MAIPCGRGALGASHLTGSMDVTLKVIVGGASYPSVTSTAVSPISWTTWPRSFSLPVAAALGVGLALGADAGATETVGAAWGCGPEHAVSISAKRAIPATI